MGRSYGFTGSMVCSTQAWVCLYKKHPSPVHQNQFVFFQGLPLDLQVLPEVDEIASFKPDGFEKRQ
jgi:hypothetical protein